jgi:hypothetical protein
MKSNISEELLNLHESLLRAQLNVVRQLRKEAGLNTLEQTKEKSMSQIDMVYDILNHSQRPMHVNDIIAIAKERFDQHLDKESVVSALAKRVKRQDRFIKTAPNTFALIAQDPGGVMK